MVNRKRKWDLDDDDDDDDILKLFIWSIQCLFRPQKATVFAENGTIGNLPAMGEVILYINNNADKYNVDKVAQHDFEWLPES